MAGEFIKGTEQTSAFKFMSAKPLDARLVLKDKDQLDALKNLGIVYPGMEVWVRGEKVKYEYLPVTGGVYDKNSNIFDFIPSRTKVEIDDTTKQEIISEVESSFEHIDGGNASDF